jgi:hypothetical protein
MTEKQDQYEWGELQFPVQKRESTKALYEPPETVFKWINDCLNNADAKGIHRLFLMELDWKEICKQPGFWEKFDAGYERFYQLRDKKLNDTLFVEQADKVITELDEFKKHFFEWPKRLDIN